MMSVKNYLRAAGYITTGVGRQKGDGHPLSTKIEETFPNANRYQHDVNFQSVAGEPIG
jgi:hypothetical protein